MFPPDGKAPVFRHGGFFYTFTPKTKIMNKKKAPHRILVRLHVRVANFTSPLNLAPYKHPETGKMFYWKDENNEPSAVGPFLNSIDNVFDISNDQDARLVEYIRNHPMARKEKKIEIIDLMAIEKVKDDNERAELQAIRKVVMMKEDTKKMLQFFVPGAKGLDPDKLESLLINKAKTEEGRALIDRYCDDKHLHERVVVRKMVDAGIIDIQHSRYYIKDELIGVSEDSVIEWLMDDPKMMKMYEAEAAKKLSEKETVNQSLKREGNTYIVE